MPAVKITFGDTVRNFQDLVRSTSKQVQKDIEEAVILTAKEVLTDVKRFTPKRSGRLRAAWTSSKSGHRSRTRVTIANATSYANYVENGTRYMAPRRMLRRAVRRGNMKLVKRLREIRAKASRNFK